MNNNIDKEIKEDIEPNYMKIVMGVYELNNKLTPNTEEYIKKLGLLVSNSLKNLYTKSINRRLL